MLETSAARVASRYLKTASKYEFVKQGLAAVRKTIKNPRLIERDRDIERVSKGRGPLQLLVKPRGQGEILVSLSVKADTDQSAAIILQAPRGKQNEYSFPYGGRPFRSDEEYIAYIIADFALKHAPAEKKKLDVGRYLKGLNYGPGGRAIEVTEHRDFWLVDLSRRERLDHFVSRTYRPGPDDDPEGYDDEGWERDYAGPIRKVVQKELDRDFGRGKLIADVDEKGHVIVQHA